MVTVKTYILIFIFVSSSQFVLQRVYGILVKKKKILSNDKVVF